LAAVIATLFGGEREHDCKDAGGKTPTVGALGDAGAVAEDKNS
jgi:hypothetical protein